jgi:hypothetical protein
VLAPPRVEQGLLHLPLRGLAVKILPPDAGGRFPTMVHPVGPLTLPERIHGRGFLLCRRDVPVCPCLGLPERPTLLPLHVSPIPPPLVHGPRSVTCPCSAGSATARWKQMVPLCPSVAPCSGGTMKQWQPPHGQARIDAHAHPMH